MKTNHSPIRTLIPIPQKHVPIRGYLLAFLAAAGLTPPLCWGATINVTLPPYSANNHGVGDAQPAIQSAINYAVANGHHLYFPKGVYNIERPLRITGNVGNFQISLIGDGRTADANGTIIRATRTMPQMLLHWRNKIHLYKMRFEGTQKAVNIVTSGTADYDTTSLPKIQTVTAHGQLKLHFCRRLECAVMVSIPVTSAS